MQSWAMWLKSIFLSLIRIFFYVNIYRDMANVCRITCKTITSMLSGMNCPFFLFFYQFSWNYSFAQHDFANSSQCDTTQSQKSKI